MAFGLRHRRSLSATACAVLAILATSATGATSASALRRFARDVAGVERSGQPRLRNRVRPSDPNCAIEAVRHAAANVAANVAGASRWRWPLRDEETGNPGGRGVALAMSVLENTGVMALGQNAVTGFPARTVARAARARGTCWWSRLG